MLPFLAKPKQAGAVITTIRPSDHEKKEPSGLELAAKDLSDAVEAKDIKRIAAALKAAFDILDSEDEAEDAPADESKSE